MRTRYGESSHFNYFTVQVLFWQELPVAGTGTDLAHSQSLSATWSTPRGLGRSGVRRMEIPGISSETRNSTMSPWGRAHPPVSRGARRSPVHTMGTHARGVAPRAAQRPRRRELRACDHFRAGTPGHAFTPWGPRALGSRKWKHAPLKFVFPIVFLHCA